MLRAHCVFLIQPTYGSGARKKPWAGRVHGGGRLRQRSANIAKVCEDLRDTPNAYPHLMNWPKE